MAAKKSDAFYIRAQAQYDGTNFVETDIDLGAYVDALGQSVLRIHNVEVEMSNGGASPPIGAAPPNFSMTYSWQLTTQSQTGPVTGIDKSLISSGLFTVFQDAVSGNPFNYVETANQLPQDWSKGYLVGVEQIYLGVAETVATIGSEPTCTIVLECTVEKLTQNAAMALALSQQ